MQKVFSVLACMIPAIASAQLATDNQIHANVLGIVTPNVATGVVAYSTFSADEKGNMVVCIPDDTVGRGSCKQWRTIQSQVPTGKKYVGFNIVMSSSTNKQLYIWWK